MSKDLFTYMEYRNGFEIMDQVLIDWGKQDLDCISLIEKMTIRGICSYVF